MLKKVNIVCGDKTAYVAKITHVEKDKSYYKCDLYAGAVKPAQIYGDVESESEVVKGEWSPFDLIETDRVFKKANLPFAFSLADYQKFYPPQPTPEEILAAKIKALRAEGVTCLARIEEIKAELKELEG